MERITEFVERKSLSEFGAPKHLKIVFSDRGGLRYSQTIAYLDLLKQQARSGTTYLDKRVIKWSVLHPNLIGSIPHNKSAGCQLADVIASSFYQAANTSGMGLWDASQAKLLRDRMWSKNGSYVDNGVTLFPPNKSLAKLDARQKEIFQFYGYKL